jgi:hypothetical protein
MSLQNFNSNLVNASVRSLTSEGPVTFGVNQAGTASVALGATTVTVPVVGLTAASMVVASLQYPLNATMTSIVSVVPAAGQFVITVNAAPTVAAGLINWFVPKL